jgi:hypothetical protein
VDLVGGDDGADADDGLAGEGAAVGVEAPDHVGVFAFDGDPFDFQQ